MDRIGVEINMKEKRILFITPSVYPQVVGGIEVFNYYVIHELGKNYKVSYLNVDTKDGQKEIKNATRHTIRQTSQFIQLIQIFFYLVKNRNNYDLIWTSFSRTAWYYIVIYPVLNILFSKEYMIVIHGGGLMPWKFKFPYQLYFKKAKAVIGVSEIICREYKKRTSVNVIHIPPLIPFEKAIDSKKDLRIKYKINQGRNVFLYVGSIKELKQPGIIVKAFKKLGKSFLKKHSILMVFAGEGYLKNKLIQECKEAGLEHFFSFKGNIPRERINEFYKMSDFYIISSDFEGTPISMLEAIYNNLPVIASNVNGINSVVNNNRGILFDNKNVDDLVNAIKIMIEDDEFKKKVCNNASRFYNKNYRYSQMINQYKQLL